MARSPAGSPEAMLTSRDELGRQTILSNLFDAAGFTVSAMWNPWASAMAKRGDFATALYSQALFGAISLVCMPLCMSRVNAKAAAAKAA